MYNTDKKKIAFILSLMTDAVLKWRTAAMEEMAHSKGKAKSGTELNWDDYETFEKRFLAEHVEVDSPAIALNKLRQLRVGRDVSTSDYITKFKGYIQKAKIEGDRAQIAMFMEGLPSSVVDEGIRKGLETMQDWYKEAL
jgi:hypothetical protein